MQREEDWRSIELSLLANMGIIKFIARLDLLEIIDRNGEERWRRILITIPGGRNDHTTEGVAGQ